MLGAMNFRPLSDQPRPVATSLLPDDRLLLLTALYTLLDWKLSLISLIIPLGAALRLALGPNHSRPILCFGAYILAMAAFQRANLPQQQLAQCQFNLKSIAGAIEMYSMDHSNHYPKSLAALTPDYLKSVPSCPSSTCDSYFGCCPTEFNPDGFTVSCRRGSHGPQSYHYRHQVHER